ncbi:NAC transcription factor 32-like [Salvia miltiorrhiza]|uniref:NAC transcription factor 32-like n=1 Tax=Salvia miltiorrhiza TaxID=226208 RepID=UPI0025AC8C40|nr:NAC transcription factor 32-like [Salvia miltiorrhiza]
MDHQETESQDQQIPAAVPGRNRYPPGFRFLPTDKQLIVEYLQKKIDNKPIPVQINETFIKHVNPRDLTANNPKLGDNEWYFFTPRDWKYSNGERPDGAADTGYWKATGADKPVIVGAVILGFRRTLEFYEGKPPNGQKTVWKIHEFRVNGVARNKTSADDMRLDDWVLCRVYAKSSRVANNRKSPVQASRQGRP